MASQQGDERHGLPFKMEYMVKLTGDKKKSIYDKDIVVMFEVNKIFSFIHVYATAVKLHEGGNPQISEHFVGENNNFVCVAEKNAMVYVGENNSMVSVDESSVCNEVSMSSSDEDYVGLIQNSGEGDEESGDNDSEFDVGEEDLKAIYSSDGLSEADDKFDRLGDVHIDEDRHDIYLDRGMPGKPFDFDADGKINLERNLIFRDVYHFRGVERLYYSRRL